MGGPFEKTKAMKTKIQIPVILIAALCLSAPLFGQGKLEVTVQNIKESKGTIRVGLFNNEDQFLKEAIEGKVVKVSGNEMTITFENLKSGGYGLSVIHDENENGELDTNMMGIPKEGFGFGNNAMGTFGPPSYDEAKVIVKDKIKVSQAVKLKYY